MFVTNASTTATYTVFLPTDPVSNVSTLRGRIYIFKNIGPGALTIDASGGPIPGTIEQFNSNGLVPSLLISGSTTASKTPSIVIQSDGTVWRIIAAY